VNFCGSGVSKSRLALKFRTERAISINRRASIL
jgi:hypothetical protein